MKKLMLILTVAFIALTIIGIGYTLYTKGNINAGFTTLPAILALVCYQMYKVLKFRDGK